MMRKGPEFYVGEEVTRLKVFFPIFTCFASDTTHAEWSLS